MFIEYNWTAGRYIIRFGNTPTSIGNERSWATLSEADAALRKRGLCVGIKTDTRTWLVANVRKVLEAQQAMESNQ
jgi:hypothetical protein